ncbi:MAG: DAK2 domain-containing protein [Clostridia bacterium]|nr:DAK2 domain-containing protein [Clostridia bacterium]
MINRIDGQKLEGMLANGYANLCLHEKKINDLNVFPVADGDTGVNMRLTVEKGLRSASPEPGVGEYLSEFSSGALLGARGNSGVILSQIIRGWYLALKEKEEIGNKELIDAFESGYRQAYAAVSHPVEGTILTVAREGLENIRPELDECEGAKELFSLYVREMKKSLANTPLLLDVLRKAGVVDSGAMGYIVFVEGMAMFLSGDILEGKPGESLAKNDFETSAVAETPDFDLFDETSSFEKGYCTEFLLRLLKTEGYDKEFDLQSFLATLETMGESIVSVLEGTRLKVHVHTKEPEKVIAFARRYGEFLTFKLENMQLQYNERQKEAGERDLAPLGIVAVVNGEEMKTLFTDLGCTKVIEASSEMNTSAEEFLDAIRKTNANRIVILPNNKNSVRAALQAASLSGKADRVTVIPTANMIEGYCAIEMDVASSEDTDYRIRLMQDGAENVSALLLTVATKDFEGETISAKKGQYLSLVDGEIVAASDDLKEALRIGLAHLDPDGKEICMAFGGKDGFAGAGDVETILGDAFPELEICPVYGGQTLYHWMIGLV